MSRILTVDAFAGLTIEAMGDAAADDKVASKRLELPKLQDSADTTGGCIGMSVIEGWLALQFSP